MRRLRDKTLLGMTENELSLFPGHAGKPLEEFIEPRTTLKVFE